AFGGIAQKNGQISPGGAGRHVQADGLVAARQAGVEFINVGPLESDVPAIAQAEWLALRPGSDVAVLLGIAHTLHTEGLADGEFLERYTVGFDVFARYLEGAEDGVVKSAEWAAGLSDLGADRIRRLARRMATERTMISTSWSLTRQDHGEQPYWAAVAVAAMLGQIGLPGGGIGFGYSATNYVGSDAFGIPGAALPQGRNPVRDFIPVARISDMLLNPGAEFDYNGQRYRYPDIHMVYWAGGNPFHHHQDLGRLIEAWRKPDTVIAHEWCWNGLAKHADIVLPCTTALERNDLSYSPRDPYIIAMRQVAKPFAQSRNDFDIFAGIAARLGVADKFTEGRDEKAWLRWMYEETRERSARAGVSLPTYETLQRDGWYRIEDSPEPKIMLKAFRDDPAANPLTTPSGRIEIFSRTIDAFGYDDCPGHPAWLEPEEWLGGEPGPWPLHLISNQPSTKLHSQLDHGCHSRAAKIHDREPIVMHPRDAAARNIVDGDLVRVFNSRGACMAGAMLDDGVRAGVVVMSTGAWFDADPTVGDIVFCKHGNPNVLTRDQGTSRLAQGPSAQSCLVEIERFDAEPPPVSAFEPPEIVGTDCG
ncbi:MAG: Asp-tRNA(Asn)/Glu-tRNA(Gln) amidotransferase GatCAB subunit C, partial [Proteobacteria bacterium]